MTRISDPKKQWNNYSSHYASTWTSGARIFMQKREMNFINKYITPQTTSVLDVGCGTGRVLNNYLINKNIVNIYGIDIAEKMIEICNRIKQDHGEIKELKVCDISKEDIPYNISFDLVSAIRVLKYNSNWREIIDKLITGCAPGGVVIFSIPNSRSVNRLSGFANLILNKDNDYLIYRSNYSELRALTNNNGYVLLEIAGFSKIPDFFYDLSNNKGYINMIISIERLLDLLFGHILFGKELFVAIKKL